MLILTRKSGETIRIGDDVTVTIIDVGAGRVRIGIDAPKDVTIVRGELVVERMRAIRDAKIRERQ